MGCQCDWEVIKRAETIVLVVVQAAPPAARKRADATYMAVFFGLFKAVSSGLAKTRIPNDMHPCYGGLRFKHNNEK
jgi:hypothetical protein